MKYFDRLTNNTDLELQPLTKRLSLTDFKKDYPLHYFAKIGDVCEVEKYLNEVNLFTPDKFSRFPGHWAALSDNLENGFACAKKMIEFIEKLMEENADNNETNNETECRRKHSKVEILDDDEEPVKTKLQEFLDHQDVNGETCLHLAAKNEAVELVEELILKAADISLLSKCGQGALALIYVNTPPAVLHLLDKGIRFIQDEENFNSRDRKYRIDFEPIVGKAQKRKKPRFPERRFCRGEDKTLQMETELLNNVKEINKRDTICNEIMTHVLVRMFLHLKWKKIRPFFYLSVVFHSTWLALYFWYNIEIYYRSCQKDILAPTNLSCWSYPFTEFGDTGDQAREQIWRSINSKDRTFRPMILLINSLFFCFKEFFQLSALGRGYLQLENIMQWAFVLCLFLTLYPSEAFYYQQYQISVFGVLFASFLQLDVVNKVTNWGIYFNVLIKVTKRFLESTPLFFVIMLTFAIALHMLFPDQIPSLETFREALMTIFLMMMGKVDYHKYEEGIDKHYPVTGLIIFVVFYVVFTILLLRILMGFIVSDTQRLLQVVGINQILTRLEQMYLKESFLLTKIPRYVPSCFNLQRFLSKLIVVPAKASKRYLVICESDIPPDLRKDIRILASKNPAIWKSDGEVGEISPEIETNGPLQQEKSDDLQV